MTTILAVIEQIEPGPKGFPESVVRVVFLASGEVSDQQVLRSVSPTRLLFLGLTGGQFHDNPLGDGEPD